MITVNVEETQTDFPLTFCELKPGKLYLSSSKTIVVVSEPGYGQSHSQRIWIPTDGTAFVTARADRSPVQTTVRFREFKGTITLSNG